MKKKKIKTVQYRRKREGKTDYKLRLKLLLSNKARLVVRKSLKNITAQIISLDKKGDKVIVSAEGKELKDLGWKFSNNNIPAAYLVGLLIGNKAKEKKVSEVILDIGLNRSSKGSKLYAVLKGAVDAGLQIPHSKGKVPEENRITGKFIEDYSKKPITSAFNQIKEKIMKGN